MELRRATKYVAITSPRFSRSLDVLHLAVAFRNAITHLCDEHFHRGFRWPRCAARRTSRSRRSKSKVACTSRLAIDKLSNGAIIHSLTPGSTLFFSILDNNFEIYSLRLSLRHAKNWNHIFVSILWYKKNFQHIKHLYTYICAHVSRLYKMINL